MTTRPGCAPRTRVHQASHHGHHSTLSRASSYNTVYSPTPTYPEASLPIDLASPRSSVSVAGMSTLNSTFDADIDSFLDLDQTFTPSADPPDLSKGKTPVTARPSLSSSNGSLFASSQSQQKFSGPSFQYDSYRQQTGLPVGGLANTFALNQASGLQYTGSNHGFIMPSETLNVPLSDLDDFDFSRHPSTDLSDMDFETDSPSEALPAMFYPSGSSSAGEFINPTALSGQEESPTYSPPIQRMYPGMHTQQAAQAAQAKAQQAAKQQEMLRQQNQRQVPGQKPLPSQKAQAQKDPHVEESISRLLNQMRQSSASSSNEDDAPTPTANLQHISHFKKNIEDMDEDELLLASEEGKKLSSKERRQLRNKVSARAFRSRRKGALYITSLGVSNCILTHLQNTSASSKARLHPSLKKSTTLRLRSSR